MKTDEQLKDQLSVLSKIDLSVPDRSELWTKIEESIDESRQSYLRLRASKGIRRVMGGIGAAAAAIVIVALILNTLHLPSMGSYGRRADFPIVINPRSVTSTPLDTVGFRDTLQTYLERYPLSSSGSSSTVSVSSNAMSSTSSPVINTISDLAVRWSQLVDNKYGFAYVSYMVNGKPGLADVLVLKTGVNRWVVQRISNTPTTLSKASLSHAPIYTGETRGAGFTSQGNDQVKYVFMSGLIVDPSITQVKLVKNDGLSIDVPIINGVFGYVQISPSGTSLYSGWYEIKAYNKHGTLVSSQS